MHDLNSRQLFVKAASKARKIKQNNAKFLVLAEIDKELKIADILLKKIEKNREAKMSTIISLNKKIFSLKNVVQGMKERLKGL